MTQLDGYRFGTPSHRLTGLGRAAACLLLLALGPLACKKTQNGDTIVNNYTTNPTAPPNFNAVAYAFDREWGGGGGSVTLNEPSGIAVRGSVVYVSDYNNARVVAFSATGEYINQYTTDSVGAFGHPSGLAVDAAGNLFVADATNHRVSKLGPNGAPITAWTGGTVPFSVTTDVALDRAGNVYVADQGNGLIQKLTAAGAPVTAWGQGSNGAFIILRSLALDAQGNLYAGDFGAGLVQKLTAAGAPVTSWGSGILTGDASTYVDPAGNVYAGDVNHVVKFAPNGVFLTQWGGPGIGTGNGTFHGVTGIAVDPSGNVYVVDFFNNVVQKFTPLP